MFKYADENQVQIYHEFCSTRLNQLKQYFSNEFNIQTKFQLIGSGSKKLVTQNNNLPFDLDYNFEILNRSIKQLDMKKLKTCVINFLNSVVYEKYEYYKKCQDSTSAITIRKVVNGNLEFSFDIAILAKSSNGNYCRLIHDKQLEKYDWNPIPESKEIFERLKELKSDGYWEDIKELYLNKKNMYLKRNEKRCSFEIFAETINEIWFQ